ncbi:MAG TPA: STAS domain-containing protein [Kouleothrix sp.]|uniref:STAS domain-containing protein n=1 Tax=Kouleothrix sp. TaxID=2779161 RepID=UPI002C0CABD2|nr:STAS domain-containing protein [Kouleothrix sp.]HRC74601.1 STAS domain-containing protein [Kouleothrix sp.]
MTNPALRKLIDAWQSQQADFVDRLVDDLRTQGSPSYSNMPREELRDTLAKSVDAWIQSLEAGDFATLVQFARQTAQHRASSQIPLGEVLHVVDILRAHLWDLMEQIYEPREWDHHTIRLIEGGLAEQAKAIISAYTDVMRDAQDLLAERDQAIAYQGRLIQELSTPIVPIYEGVLVLPLTGAVDSRRATQVMEAVLEKIVGNQADVLILDITGVPVVDTGVANYLIQMARAVNLLGAQVVLVGIGPEIAQTIVQLGVELRNIITRSNLQAGIEYALRQRGYAIQRLA